MEPPATAKRIRSASALVAVALALGACQPSADTVPDASASRTARPAQPAPAMHEEPEGTASRSAAPSLPAQPATSAGAPGQDKARPAIQSGPAPADEKREPATLPEGPDLQAQPLQTGAAPMQIEGSAQTEAEAMPSTEVPTVLEADGSDEDQAQDNPKPLVPLVDDPDGLQQLHPNYPVWIDRDSKHVVTVGRVCQREVPLELFACMKGSKEHEAVVAIDTKAYVLHAGLLAVGAEPGSPVRFDPVFAPPSGPEIEVAVVWEDELGRRRRAHGQDWVRDLSDVYTMFQGLVLNEFDEELNITDQWASRKAMDYPWVFAGSQFVKDERTGDQYYQADIEGDLICVSNFPSAVLDVPIRSTDSNAALLFDAFTERIPPRGTPVTLILTPKLDTRVSRGAETQSGDPKQRKKDGASPSREQPIDALD